MVLNDRVYKVLKWVALIALPALNLKQEMDSETEYIEEETEKTVDETEG